MFSVSIQRKTNNLEKLIKRMEALENETVETGVFIEQGEHPNAQMSYVELAVMHEQGDGYFPPRTVRPLIMNTMKEQPFLRDVAKNISGYLFRDVNLNYTLGYIGQKMSFIGKNFFGEINMPWMSSNAAYTIQDKGFNAPLVDEGHLRDAWAYKTSVSDYIVDSNFGG